MTASHDPVRRIELVDLTRPEARDAGVFGAWLATLESAAATRADMNVPCGDCNACCRAGYFIAIEPDEGDTLGHIPPELVFPAPGRPGHRVMGFDEAGRCPMLVDGVCSIYPHRPRSCRHYDCRIFTAAGFVPDDPPRRDVARRASCWTFRYSGGQDRDRHRAIRAAGRFLEDHADELGEALPATATQRALAALHVHPLFLHRGAERPAEAVPSVASVADALGRR